MADRWIQTAAGGALLSALILLVALAVGFYSHLEESVEFLMLLAMVPLFPAGIALHRLLGPYRPRASRWLRFIGLLGTSVLLVSPLLALLLAVLNRTVTALGPILMGLMGLAGVWQMGIAWLGWRTKQLPAGLVLAALLSGGSWVIIISSTLAQMAGLTWSGGLSSFLGLNVLVWGVAHLVFTLGLAWYLWRHRWPVEPGRVDVDPLQGGVEWS